MRVRAGLKLKWELELELELQLQPPSPLHSFNILGNGEIKSGPGIA